MGAVDVEERSIADNRFGSGTPATYWYGLSSTTPNDDGTNFTEPSTGSYARVSKTNNTTNFPAATTTSGVTSKSNGTAITFPNPTADWLSGAPITHWGVFTASSGGTPVYTAALDEPQVVKSGNTPVEFPIGGWSIVFD